MWRSHALTTSQLVHAPHVYSISNCTLSRLDLYRVPTQDINRIVCEICVVCFVYTTMLFGAKEMRASRHPRSLPWTRRGSRALVIGGEHTNCSVRPPSQILRARCDFGLAGSQMILISRSPETSFIGVQSGTIYAIARDDCQKVITPDVQSG